MARQPHARAYSLTSPWNRLSRGDRVGLAVLIAIPILAFVPFSLLGHPLLPGDDLTQNYPLRVLSGAVIRSGHLPAWDPFIWSGTPLLAGWNAGALYPGTWLFAVLPGVAAWTVNLVAVGVISGTGVYVLLRLLGCSPLGATIAGTCFTFTGIMSGQLDHIGLVQGTGYTAWLLVAVEMLVRSPGVRVASRSVLLLASAFALCVLAGEPRAISSAGIILAIYLAARALSLGWRARALLVGAVLSGVALGAGISAIQWLPGLTFLSGSQRTLDAYQAFGSGSLHLEKITSLLLVPFLIGGNGDFGLPVNQGGFNMPELTIGVGLLPLVAACAYLPELCSRWAAPLAHSLGRRTPGLVREGAPSPPGRRLGVWYTMAIIGLLLTLGTTTPLGHLLADVPLYGGERLQNRNAAILDFALAILFGFFVDDLTARNWRTSGPLGTRMRRMLAGLPVLGSLALIVLAYLRPKGMQARLGVARPVENLFVRLTPYLASTAALGIVLGLFIVVGGRLSRRDRSVIISVLAVCDIGLYVANASYGVSSSALLAGSTRTSAQLAALTGSGRFALYNPLNIALPSSPGAFPEVGQTDLNILRGVMSVQGYGSIVAGGYQDATSTHDFGELNPSVLANGLADTLDLRTVLTLPAYLDEGIPVHSAIPVAGGPPVSSNGLPGSTADAPAPSPLASGPWPVAAHGQREWLLTSVPSVIRVTIVANQGPGGRPASLEVATFGPGSSPTFTTVPVVNGQAHLDRTTPIRAEAVVVRNPTDRPVTIGAVVATTHRPGERLLLDGALQDTLARPGWSYAGLIGPFTAFVNNDHTALTWLQSTSSNCPNVARRIAGTVTTSTNASTGAEQMDVSTPQSALVVRSVAYQSGWTATLTPLAGGPRRVLKVERLGLVQAIAVPPGRFRISWRYAPRGVLVAVAGSAAGLAALFCLAVLELRRRQWAHSLQE